VSTDVSPEAVARRFIGTISAWRFDEVWPMYAEDVVVEVPYAIPEPQRMVGRETLREHFAKAGAIPLRMTAENIVVRETTDPEVVVIEYDYHGQNSETGKSFVAANIMVMRVRDGLIRYSRDFHDHRRIADAIQG